MRRLASEIFVPTAVLTVVVAVVLGVLAWASSRELRELERDAAHVRSATALALVLTEAAEDEERWVGSLASGVRVSDERIAEARSRMTGAIARVGALDLPPRVAETWRAFVEVRTALGPLTDEVVAAARLADADAARGALDRWYLLNDRSDRLLRDFSAYQLGRLNRTVSDLQVRHARAFGAAAAAVIAGLLVAVLFATLVVRTVVRPIRAMARAAVRIRETGTATPVAGAERSDELGVLARAFNAMTERLVSTNVSLGAANRSLEEAHARLEEADRRKNQFIAVLSHELRNPLSPIRNSVFILERAAPDGAQAARARAVIARQVEQLAHLVDDLLDVTRITRGKITLQRRPLELNELVARTVEDHRGEFGQRAVEIRIEPAPGGVHVDADPHRISQVIGNLLLNAAKFTPPAGRVTVSIAADAGRGHAVVSVVDTGTGMPPEVVARLFEPFMQADTTLDRSKGGLGLGLALVKGLVELHGGSVEARSAGPGCGAEFTVRLPLRPGASPQPSAGA